MKRTSTTTPDSETAPIGRTRIGQVVFKLTAAPANDSGHRQAALVALVDDLAAFAVALHFSDRFPQEKSGKRDGKRGRKRRNGL